MDMYSIVLALGLMFLAWRDPLQFLLQLCCGLVSTLQFLLVMVYLNDYFNAFRVLRVVLVRSALEDRLQEVRSSASYSSLQISQEQALLGTQAQVNALLVLLQAHGSNPLWSATYGSGLDALLTDFERVLTPAEDNNSVFVVTDMWAIHLQHLRDSAPN